MLKNIKKGTNGDSKIKRSLNSKTKNVKGSIREAAKKLFFVARPLRGGGGVRPYLYIERKARIESGSV